MQLFSQLPANTPFRGLVAPLPVTESGYPAAFRQSPSGTELEGESKQKMRLFDLLQQALTNVDFRLQSRCIAFDIQMATDEKVLAETPSFVLLLQTLVEMAAGNAPIGACINITAERMQNQLVIVVREESSRMGENAAERLIGWFTGNKPKPSFNPAQVAIAQRIAGQHGGKMVIHASHKACLIVQVPLV